MEREKIISLIGSVSVYMYILSLTFPFPSYMPLILLSISGCIATLFGESEIVNVSPRIFHPILIFLCSMTVSSIVSVDIKRSIILSLSFLPALLILLLIIKTINLKNIWILFIIFSISGLLISLTAFHSVMRLRDGYPSLWIKNMNNPNILVPNDLIILIILIPFSVNIVRQTKIHIIFRILSLISIILSLSIITIYQSRGALLLVIIALFCVIIFFKSYKFVYWGMAVFCIILLSDMILGLKLVSKLTGIWTSRLVYWLIAWKIFLNSPVLGSGPHTYGTLYTMYKNKLDVPKWIEVDERFAPWPHNLYLEVLAEQGIFGLISFLILMACGLTSAWNICKTSEHTEIGNFGKSIFISLFLLDISAIFELSFLRHWVVIMLFSILGIIMALSSNLKDQRRR